jgi:hypothetical protein
MSWIITVIVRHYIFSLVVAARPQAIPDRVGGGNLRPSTVRAELVEAHLSVGDRPFTLRQAQGERRRTASAANHPTHRALRGDLRCRNQRSLTVVGEIYLQEHYKKAVSRRCQDRSGFELRMISKIQRPENQACTLSFHVLPRGRLRGVPER